MPDKRARQIAGLLGVQRARRAAAQAALLAARRSEDEAGARDDAARARIGEAAQEWRDCLGEAAFSPDQARLFAAGLLAAQAESEAASLALGIARDTRLRRGQDWQRLEAQVRSGSGMLDRLRRRDQRRREERRLAELSDRVTFDWSAS